jgi:hypothetical protein
VIDLSQAYRDVRRPRTPDDLALSYAAANRRGQELLSEALEIPDRPIGLLASAIPSVATLSVAIHLVHTLPAGPRDKLADELVGTAAINAADALHRCHLALELDGRAHGYTADEWLPVVCDAAAPLIESSQLETDPPSLVQQAQEAVRWLAGSIARLDEDSRETPAALADTIACLLVVWVFVDAAMTSDSRED